MSGAAALRLPAPIPYPERRVPRETVWMRAEASAGALLRARAMRWQARGLGRIVAAASAAGVPLIALSDEALRARADAARRALQAAPDWPAAVLAEALAVVREAAHRVLGQRAYDTQMLGAAAALRGMAAEMATGEGKTLAAMIAAATAALGGVPVHLVTVNAYLAERDAAAGAPLYRFLGLTSGLVTETVPPEQRRAAYRSDIAVCTGKDLAFDYMRDRVAAGRRIGTLRLKAAVLAGSRPGAAAPLLRGLHFAIIDEADSVLIDEARTPLILAARAGDATATAVADAALAIAAGLRVGADYAVLQAERRVVLSRAGVAALAAAVPEGAPWDEPAERERLIGQALTALHTLHRDEHYVVRDGRAELVDEFTGRIMADRSWSDGLQEMVERKEGLALSERHATMARMTYQRFFRRYRRLAGMSGTLAEVAGELWRVYRMPVAAIPRNRPPRVVMRAVRAAASAAGKWQAVADEVAAIHAAGAPVLIGTRTVAGSAQASAALAARGLPHVLLNAVTSGAEAEVIAAAGVRGAVMVATNMAGRGTDIGLTEAARAAGGLHVILSEPHEARRIDRQLAGRGGRQGDPGAVLPFCALDDALVERHGPRLRVWLARRLGSAWMTRAAARSAQRRAERLHARMRRDLLRSDEWLGDAVAFAGESE